MATLQSEIDKIIKPYCRDPSLSHFAADKVAELVVKNFTASNTARDEICPECAGRGFTYGRLHDTKITCSNCRGQGKLSPVA